ncbi:Uu.00g090310.m01.CDS01 [Anthostomella pinea]|uniref:Uu.00g090310.m01.CDS01 n=1 Tax=Anthostomella pinea TaxID=933095 RepID=A0AAI8YK91_9PEZI|nr:Uu.00g090310.m01.CDS01 [Anthostomella pinea]
MLPRPTQQLAHPLRALTLRRTAPSTSIPRLSSSRLSSSQLQPQPQPQSQAQPRAKPPGLNASAPPPKPNPAAFWKTFGRPIAKVFLGAIFTYQLAYYFWVRLEHDEVKSDMQATISDLEARIEELEKGRKR